MYKITKPMLAATIKSDSVVLFPVLATPKIDGIRALKINGILVSRNFKPIPNVRIRTLLENILPEGVDGEIVCGENFWETSSAVMMSVGSESFGKKFIFYWFDWVTGNLEVPYYERIQKVQSYILIHDLTQNSQLTVVPLIPKIIYNWEELHNYESLVLSVGFEGVIVRKPDGEYKCGRSTIREGLLIKIKRFQDSEATIIRVEELMHNHNDLEKDLFGYSRRSTSKEGLIGGNTLGAIIAKTNDGIVFRIGTGYTKKETYYGIIATRLLVNMSSTNLPLFLP